MKWRVLLNACLFLVITNGLSQNKEFFQTCTNETILLYKQVGNRMQAHGTASIFFNYETTTREYILVTCAHLTGYDTLVAAVPALDSIKQILLSLDQKNYSVDYNGRPLNLDFDGSNFLIKIPLIENYNLFRYPNLDLAVIYTVIPASLLTPADRRMRIMGSLGVPNSLIAKKEEIFAGQDIFFVGFPFGIGTTTSAKGFNDVRTNPLIRKGIVSWTSENSNEFLLDGFSYGGNSGSPIFSPPTPYLDERFIGMVVGHLTDSFLIEHFKVDTTNRKNNYSTTKQRVDINDGLARFIPAFIINDFINDVSRKRKRIYQRVSNRKY